MIIVSYDFSNDKIRSQFSKFLKKFGHRWQYSVFNVSNSPRILQNILKEIELGYVKRIKNTDSVLLFQLCSACKKKVTKYGYSSNLDKKVIVFK